MLLRLCCAVVIVWFVCLSLFVLRVICVLHMHGIVWFVVLLRVLSCGWLVCVACAYCVLLCFVLFGCVCFAVWWCCVLC